VAVFDVLKAAGRQQPFVLLQPRARLQDIMPHVDFHGAARTNKLPNLNSAFVGIVEETGSLFAMSPDHFPFVVFGDTNAYESQRLIEPPPGEVINNEDSYQWVKRPLAQCRTYSGDRSCLTGVRRLEASSRSRLSRLLDGAPSVSLPPSQDPDPPVPSSKFNVSIVPTWIWRSPIGSPRVGSKLDGVNISVGVQSTTISFLFALVLGIFWMVRKVFKTYSSHYSQVVTNKSQSPEIPETPEKPSTDLSPPLPILSLQEDLPLDPPPPAVNGTPVLNAVADDIADAEESEREVDTPALPGKKKGLRRKRGKKKKANVNESPPEGDTDQVDTEDPLRELDTHPMTPEQPLVVQAVSSQPSSTAASSLIVSDTVLGKWRFPWLSFNLIISRCRVSWHNGFSRVLPGTRSCGQAFTSGFRNLGLS
jgi:serine/threonine-protein kinase/endoribonuclease IRE1